MGFDAVIGPNWIVPTAPAGDSSNRVANTQFVATTVASSIASTLASAFLGTTGFVLQTVYNQTTTLIAQTSTMQGNFTSVPIKTDGFQILTATITPFATTNNLLVRAVAPMSSSSGNNIIMALYQDTTTSALAATITFGVAGGINSGSIVHNLTANTTGPTTFKLNVMNFSTIVATWVVNGSANPNSQFLGGALRATLVIQETKV
jgi:hypothetical protein